MSDRMGEIKAGWKREDQEPSASIDRPGSIMDCSPGQSCSHTITRPIFDLGIKTCEKCGRVLGFI